MSEEAKNQVKEDLVSKQDYEKALQRSQLFEAKLTDLEKKLQGYASLGDVENLKGKLSDYDNIRKQNASDPDEIEALIAESRAEIEERYKKELEEKEKLLAQTDERLHQEVVVNKISADWASELTPDGLKIAQQLYIGRYIKKDEDGYYIVDDNGKPRYNGVNRITPNEFLGELKEIVPSIFADKSEIGTAKRGSASASKNTSGAVLPKGLSKAEQTQWFSEHTNPDIWK